MQEPSMLDSKELMDYHIAKYGKGCIDKYTVAEWSRKIAEDMKDFAWKERIRNAKAAEALSKFIITA
jgi:hypothetical protein